MLEEVLIKVAPFSTRERFDNAAGMAYRERFMNLSTVLGRLRLIGCVEGWSYLLLLFVAMPLKYLAGEPGAVRVVGMAHGILFIACVLAAFHAHLHFRWSIGRTALILGSTLVPFGTFVVDRRLLSRLV